ncbi:MAG: AmmeMemoRadiSam system radical SAM enzyme [Elusimicrobiales bacterium]|nr:AmmeMemoRadiSam system radical SAM enzyme [Elusimicrobiales bacterium]
MMSGRVQCVLCPHMCVLEPGQRGRCTVRLNVDGELVSLVYGRPVAVHVDPVEKKPFFHALPGTVALSFGMYGCNFRCSFCQNHDLADPAAAARPPYAEPVSPARIAEEGRCLGASMLASTYNEPLITAEWGAAVLAEGKKAGLAGAFVSNGYATPEALDFLRPSVDCFNVDLKFFREETYAKVAGARLEPVKTAIRLMLEKGFWVEIVTLLIPGLNDSKEEVSEMAAFLASLSRDMPWHITAFHPSHLMRDRPRTSAAALEKAFEAGLAAGLKYVYTGNTAGGRQDTVCPSCGDKVVERDGYAVRGDLISPGGKCGKCGAGIAGFWRTKI